MLLGDRVVFAERHLLGLRAAVFARHVEEARVGGGKKLDLDVGGLGHGDRPCLVWCSLRARAPSVEPGRGKLSATNKDRMPKVKCAKDRAPAVRRPAAGKARRT